MAVAGADRCAFQIAGRQAGRCARPAMLPLLPRGAASQRAPRWSTISCGRLSHIIFAVPRSEPIGYSAEQAGEFKLGSRKRPARAAAPTVGELIFASTARLARAHLAYGHGTDNAFDEAAALVFHALRLSHDAAPASYA